MATIVVVAAVAANHVLVEAIKLLYSIHTTIAKANEVLLNKVQNQIIMTRNILTIIFIFIITGVVAQTPEDAIKTSWFTQNGSARVMAVGGVMGSLGGDISANHINPAGLGLYKTKELVFSPNFHINNNGFNYRSKDTAAKGNTFTYGIAGIVLGYGSKRNSKVTSSAFSLSVSQLANYNNTIQFKGFNNQSSFSEQYLEELTYDKADTNAALNNYIFGSSLAYRTYLIDTMLNTSGQFIGYKSLVPLSTGVNQEYFATQSGGYHEIAIGGAANLQDKWYVGGSLTIPIVSFRREVEFKETDATNNPNNQFGYMHYKESFRSNGVGIGAKLGAIYKPAEFWRLGLAIHTPQFISFRDEIRASMITNTESYAGTISETSNDLNSNNPGEREYTLMTPMRIIASGSYVFREVSNTKKQRAFLSADIEYVNYRGARFSKYNEEGEAITGYYRELNNAVKNYYKANFNFKLGGELKFDPIMIRAGIAYYGRPYKSEDLKANRFVTSIGLGYRSHGMFFDITLSRANINDVAFAYRLVDKPNTFANRTGSLTNVVATLGFKL